MAGDRDEPPTTPWRMAHMGLEFAGAALICGAIGWWVDSHLGSEPWGLAIGLTIGLVGGFYLFIKEALRANR